MAGVNPLPANVRALPELGPVLDFLRLIWRVDHGLQRMSKHMDAELGVTGPQRLVLRIVGRFPSLPAGQLANLLHVHASTLTGILKRLEGRGLIDRRVDPRDRRRVRLGLTPAGRQLNMATEETIETAVERTLARLSRSKIESSQEVLGALAQALDDALACPPRR